MLRLLYELWCPCRLSGHTHQVYTGVALIRREAGQMECFHEITNVTFSKLDDQVLESYIQSGEPLLVGLYQSIYTY